MCSIALLEALYSLVPNGLLNMYENPVAGLEGGNVKLEEHPQQSPS